MEQKGRIVEPFSIKDLTFRHLNAIMKPVTVIEALYGRRSLTLRVFHMKL
jgi:hypothetical protein